MIYRIKAHREASQTVALSDRSYSRFHPLGDPVEGDVACSSAAAVIGSGSNAIVRQPKRPVADMRRRLVSG